MNIYKVLTMLTCFGFASFNVQASTVSISPSDCNIGINCEVTNTNGGPDTSAFSVLANLSLVYKFNAGGTEDGSLAGSYTTGLNSDRSGGTIAFDGGDSVDCVDPCYLLVKDGNHSPARYLFDLTNLALAPFSWDGQMDLELSGFWPNQGEISHVAIFGNTNTSAVPLPAAVWLFGTALVGFVGVSRRRKIS